METERNLVSIVLPVYNGQRFLGEAISSCLQQTHTNIELIIINDCYTDQTIHIAESFADKDKRIRIVTNTENQKLPKSLNIGHKIAKGAYVTWTSDDNILEPEFIESLLSCLKKTEADVVYSSYRILREDGSYKDKICDGSQFHLFNNIVGASFLYTRKVFEVLEGYAANLFLVEDYDFWLRASLQFKMIFLNKFLYVYRSHADSLTSEIFENTERYVQYKKALIQSYTCLGSQFGWNTITPQFLSSFHNGEEESLNFFLNNSRVLKRDLATYYHGKLDLEDFETFLYGKLFKIDDQSKKIKNRKVTLKIIEKDWKIFRYSGKGKMKTFKIVTPGLMRNFLYKTI